MKHLIQSNIELLDQLSDVLSQLKIDDYKLPLEIYSGSSMGQHTRHILSFFGCLITGNQANAICFDSRNRNTDIENNPATAILEVKKIIKELHHIDSDKKIIFLSTIDGHSDRIHSTIARELLYVIEHTVHHMAIIKMGALINFSYVKFSKHFGVAQSTIDYQKTCAQ